jgi:predicted amidophosphoribosyltransferase
VETPLEKSRELTTDEARSFVWPPRPVIEAPPPPAPVQPRVTDPEPVAKRLARWWMSIEETWLDPVALPIRRRADIEGWAPDPPAAYCDRCGRDIGEFEAGEFGCAQCANARLPWERFARLGRYEDPLAEWIGEVKFTRWRVLGFELGKLLGKRIRDAGFVATPRAAAVPVPSTLRRRLTRGIDHAAVIARGVSMELGIPLLRALRRKHRPSQRSVPSSQRERNVAKSFWRKPGIDLSERSIILIDDVMTSGATLRGSARALSVGTRGCPAGRIWAGVLGVTPGRH